MVSKEELVKLIDNSPLFTIDKESCPMQYMSERYRLLTLLTDYYRFFVFPTRPLDSYSMVLVESAVECIKYYDASRGSFLHLFSSVMKRELGIAKAKELIDSRRSGIKLTIEDDRLIRKILSFANSKCLDIHDTAVQEKISKALNISVLKLNEMIRINDNAVTVENIITTAEGDETNIFDTLSSADKSVEDMLIEDDSATEIVEHMVTVFNQLQARQKKMISMIVTAEIIKSFDLDLDRVRNIAGKCVIFNEEVAAYCKDKAAPPTARQIAKWCGVSEQSASRAYKNFRKKLNQRVNSRN